MSGKFKNMFAAVTKNNNKLDKLENKFNNNTKINMKFVSTINQNVLNSNEFDIYLINESKQF